MKLDLRTYGIGAGVFSAIAFIGMLVFNNDEWHNAIWTDTALVVAAWVGTGFLTHRARRSRPGARWKWGLLAAGLGLEAIAETVWWVYEIGLRAEVPFPGPPDMFYLAGYFFLAAGLLAVVPPHASWLPRGQAIADGIYMTAILVLVSWVVVLSEVVLDAEGGSFLETSVYVAYPILDVLIAGLALTFIARSARDAVRFMGFLAGGILIWAVGDSAYLLLDIQGVYGGGYPTDITWILGYMLVGATAFLPLPETTGALGWRPANWQRAVPWVFLLGALVVGLRELVVRPGVGVGFLITVSIIILASAVRQNLAVLEVDRLQVKTQQDAESAQAFVENANDLVLLFGSDLDILFVNPAVEKLIGDDYATMRRNGIAAYTHQDDVGPVMEAFAELAEAPGSRLDLEIRARTHDGTYRTLAVTASNQFDNPDLRGILVNAHDATEERRRLHEKMQVEHVEQLMEDRRRLLNGAAHVLKTPLTPAMLQLATLRSERFGPLTEKQGEALSSVERNLHRLQETSEDIVAAFRIQSDPDVEPQRLDMAHLVKGCVELEHVTVQDPDGWSVAWAMADPSLARQAVCALLRHAVRAPADTLDVRIQASPEIVSVSVKEPREGVTDERARHYMDPFGHDLETRSGLSLYICRTAAEKQGGGLRWVDGDWVLTLPAAGADASGALED